MHDKPMTLDDFEAGLDRHGADLERWPADAAAQGRRLLAASSDARALMTEARDMAALLGEALPAATLTSAALRSRILAEVTHDGTRSRAFAWLTGGSRILRPVAIAAALIPLFLGYAIGVGYQPGGVSEDLASDVSLLAFADYETYTDAN
jgi:hypothetical protein